MTPKIIEKIFTLTGRKPKSKEEAVSLIHEKLEDLGEDSYLDIDDLDVLIDVLDIFERGTLTPKINPYTRKGGSIVIDEWADIDEVKELNSFAEKNKWVVNQKSIYYTYSFNDRIFFKMDSLMKTSSGKHSCKITITKIIDKKCLYSFLDNYNLNEFKDRRWSINKRQDAMGRFFFIDEVHKFITEIKKRT